MNPFFIITPPGFEAEAEKELREIWSDLLSPTARPHDQALPEIRRLKGGLEIETELFTAVQLNFFMKTASRILLRVDQFRVRDFPKLHQKLEKLSLKPWLGEASAEVRASAQSSRLGQEKRVMETARSAWKWKEAGVHPHRVDLRLENDVCMVSLDTSGEHLHRRGFLELRGEAPMRETLAAFCLRKMMKDASPAEMEKVTLLDPMCGSGTLLMEAATLWTGSYFREFSFQSFHSLPKLFKQPQFARNYRLKSRPSPFAKVVGRDVDGKILQAARKNYQAAAQKYAELKIELIAAEFSEHDVLQAAPAVADPLWIVVNPPYGERLKTPPPAQIVASLLEMSPQRIGMLWPDHTAAKLEVPKGYELVSATKLKNGGLDTAFLVWKVTHSPVKGC